MLPIRFTRTTRLATVLPAPEEKLGGRFEKVFKYRPDQARGERGTREGGKFVKEMGTAESLVTDEGKRYTDEEVKGIIGTVLSPADTERYYEELQRVRDDFNAGRETYKLHSVNGDGTGGYTLERKAVHEKILAEMVARMATQSKPQPGEPPTLIMLGGRGGSGKSNFKESRGLASAVYDETKTFYIDADILKDRLSEEDKGHGKGVGADAALYHEESSHLATQALAMARKMGLNVVLDATMKRHKPWIIKAFKEEGYKTETHYMQLSREEAVKRAATRWRDEGGRLVLPEVIMGNINNERNFDKMAKLADKSSVWDNDVPKGTPPKRVVSKR
jgi:predicted ABC-type ATPase